MQDVADAVGVHRTTVSRALRDDPRISEVTRERVKGAADRLGYRTNPLVAVLMSHRRAVAPARFQAVMAFVTQGRQRGEWAGLAPSFRRIQEAAAARAERQGYKLEEFWTGGPPWRPETLPRVLIQRGIHGMVIAPLRETQGNLELDCRPFSCVTIGYSVVSPDVARVAPDHFQGMNLAMNRCREFGLTRPGLVLAEGVHERVGRRWLGAYLAATTDVKVPPPLVMDAFAPAEFRAWFQKHRPDVILTARPDPVRAALRGLQVKVPDGVGLVSLEADSAGGVAGIDQHFEKVGAAAVDLVISMLHRGERGGPADRQLLIEPSWIDGPTLLRRVSPPGKGGNAEIPTRRACV
jgi:Transcriptional regulators